LPYLIDGHNLIGALPDLALDEPDDELRLSERLLAYFKRSRQRAVLFFDRGHVASQAFRRGHWLQIRFVRSGRTADDAIRGELGRIGREAPNWTVVSSDREVQAAARLAGAKVLSSQQFIERLAPPGPDAGEAPKPDRPLSPDELDDWLALFNGGSPDKPDQEH